MFQTSKSNVLENFLRSQIPKGLTYWMLQATSSPLHWTACFTAFYGGENKKKLFFIWASVGGRTKSLVSASYFHSFIPENKWSNRKKLSASSLLQALNRNSNSGTLKCTFHCIDWTLELKWHTVLVQVFRKDTLNTRLRRYGGNFYPRFVFLIAFSSKKKKSRRCYLCIIKNMTS